MQQIQFREVRHFHIFSGLGGGAQGFNRGTARLGNMVAKFRCIGGIDIDVGGVEDFGRTYGRVPATLLDLFDEGQYRDFHGHAPPSGWREATPEDIRQSSGNERPHIVFLSAPCKGFSGLLSGAKSETAKYRALNKLTLRGMWLMLEAFSDNPPELIIFENVPRIASRGRGLLDQIMAMLRSYGYAVSESTHNCGELGGLAENRERFLLTARHIAKVPPFLYEPPKRRMKSVGEVLRLIPPAGDTSVVGPMHRLPELQWLTWLRLAFVEAGRDWRSLNRLKVENGQLADYGLVPENVYRNSVLGVVPWDARCGTVAGRSGPTNGAYSVADPRPGYAPGTHANIYKVVADGATAPTVTGAVHTAGGALSVADPRPSYRNAFGNVMRVVGEDETSPTVTGGHSPSNGALAVADRKGTPAPSDAMGAAAPSDAMGAAGKSSTPVYRVVRADPAEAPASDTPSMAVTDFRPSGKVYTSKYRVTKQDEQTGTVISASTTGQGAFAVADDRGPWTGRNGLMAVPANALAALPAATDRLIATIIAEDGTWHRPFTTYELAALQSLVIPGEHLELYGTNDSAHRERIGNAVPPDAAEAIASTMGMTLLLAWSGESFMLSNLPIWVQPMAVSLSVRTEDNVALDM